MGPADPICFPILILLKLDLYSSQTQLYSKGTGEHKFNYLLAPEVGLEPTTHRLTADCSAIELLGKVAGNVRNRTRCRRACQDRLLTFADQSGFAANNRPVTSPKPIR